jgi:ferritin-like metal-binding protein YciE
MAKEPKTLDDLFHGTLKDIYFAEKRILATLPKMAKAAQNDELTAAFEKHRVETEGHVEAGKSLFHHWQEAAGENLRRYHWYHRGGRRNYEGVQGFTCPRRGLARAAQAVEHYEISRYGTLRTWAEELGLNDAASLLQETLDEEKATDQALTKIAETVVNQEGEDA